VTWFAVTTLDIACVLAWSSVTTNAKPQATSRAIAVNFRFFPVVTATTPPARIVDPTPHGVELHFQA
jgi:hypothetical protein